jgi:hypothetical protein
MTRQSGDTPLPISTSNHSMILSTVTQNTPGMNTFTLQGTRSRNAFLKNKRGVPERSVWLLSKIPFWQVDRLKNEHISQKDGSRNSPPVRSLEQHPTFCG